MNHQQSQMRRSLQEDVRTALSEGDLRRCHDLMVEAHGAGAPPLWLFVHVMRPALAAARPSWLPAEAAEREGEAVRSLVHTFGELLGETSARRAGAGRRAVLIGEKEGPGLLDRQVLTDLLERDGWMVSAVAPDRRDIGRLVEQLEPAAVVFTGDVPDGVAQQRIRERLPNLDSRPLLVRCLLEPADQGGAALRLEIDAAEPEGVGIDRVLERLARRFDDAGLAAWGVSMRRASGEVLVVTPSGHLDAANCERLREVVESRRGSFSSVVLNLRELSSSEEPALGDLLRWAADEGWPEPGVAA